MEKDEKIFWLQVRNEKTTRHFVPVEKGVFFRENSPDYAWWTSTKRFASSWKIYFGISKETQTKFSN